VAGLTEGHSLPALLALLALTALTALEALEANALVLPAFGVFPSVSVLFDEVPVAETDGVLDGEGVAVGDGDAVVATGVGFTVGEGLDVGLVVNDEAAGTGAGGGAVTLAGNVLAATGAVGAPTGVAEERAEPDAAG